MAKIIKSFLPKSISRLAHGLQGLLKKNPKNNSLEKNSSNYLDFEAYSKKLASLRIQRTYVLVAESPALIKKIGYAFFNDKKISKNDLIKKLRARKIILCIIFKKIPKSKAKRIEAVDSYYKVLKRKLKKASRLVFLDENSSVLKKKARKDFPYLEIRHAYGKSYGSFLSQIKKAMPGYFY